MSYNNKKLMSAEVKNDLIEKVTRYTNRSPKEQNELVIFTDHRNARELGRRIPNASIHTEYPLVPIPNDYLPMHHEGFGWTICDFVRKQTSLHLDGKFNFWFCLFDNGGPDTPKISLLFNKEKPQIDLKTALADVSGRCCMHFISPRIQESSESTLSSTPSPVAHETEIPQIKLENDSPEHADE